MQGMGKRLREIREKNGYTQKQIAEYLKITPQAYSLYELDKRVPKHETILELSLFYNCWMGDLYGWNESQNKKDPKEEQLISNYRQLNNAGREKLIDYSEDLTRIQEYRKD